MKNIKYVVLILIVVMLAVALGITGCISGITSVGWGGGTVIDNTLYIGVNGRLEAIDLTKLDSTGYRPEFSPQITMTSTSGGLSCLCGSAKAPIAIYGSPVIAGGLAYFAGYDGKIYQVYTNSINGSLKEFFPGAGSPPSKPFVGGLIYNMGVLYIGDSEGYVHALDALTGVEIWKVAPEGKKSNQKIWATPAVNDNTLYIGSFDKKLYALNTADGSKKWEFATKGPVMATPVINNGIVYFGSLDRNFYALNAADGKEKWHISASKWFWTPPVFVDNTMYIGGQDWNVYLVDPASGSIKSTIKLNGPIASPSAVSGNFVVFVTMTGGTVWKIDTGTQEKINLVTLGYNVDGPAVASAGYIYVRGYSGGGCSGTTNLLKRVNINDGKITNIPLN